jgi:hypothetical protein
MVTLQGLDDTRDGARPQRRRDHDHARGLGRSVLVPRVDTLVLRDDDERIVIPWACGSRSPATGWCCDEDHATVERTDADGWRARLARARRVALPA